MSALIVMESGQTYETARDISVGVDKRTGKKHYHVHLSGPGTIEVRPSDIPDLWVETGTDIGPPRQGETIFFPDGTTDQVVSAQPAESLVRSGVYLAQSSVGDWLWLVRLAAGLPCWEPAPPYTS